MTIYELIKELTDYPADTEIYAKVESSDLSFDVDGLDVEFHNSTMKGNRVVIVLSS